MNQKQTNTKSLSPWIVYLICLGFSTVFFLCFGFNSPIHTFNTDHDYQWFMTMGNGLVHGKIPYRDLFEQKGPIVYFVTAFCCLFPKPGIAMLFIEIISMSLFFFFAYRICRKTLNSYFSLILIPILAFTIFTSWCRIFSAATIEEFALPIYTYFLLCWLEFLQEKRHWNWIRALCLGLCFGIIFWTKYTLLYFMIVPMIIWLIISLRRRQYKILLMNTFITLAGVLIISTPIIIFYTLNHALDDLFHVYFFLNLTAYSSTTFVKLCTSFGLFFTIGPLLLIFMLWGVIAFTIKHWRERSGKLLLIAFLINFALLVYSCKNIMYYYAGLIPYAIFGIIDLLELISKKTKLNKTQSKDFYSLQPWLICTLHTLFSINNRMGTRQR
ncbi:MAG: glycosyltransferase family 39 protein [Clostridia bacterium]|nr:glycosyltransferase family 39 protein [Clostridia bacterium]